MNIICLDYGKSLIEICIGEDINFSFYKYFSFKNFNFKRKLHLIIKKWNIKFLLLGYPNFYKKNDIFYIKLLFDIKNNLKYIVNKFNLKVKIFNENFSSSFLNFKKKNSAKFILNEYFNFIRRW